MKKNLTYFLVATALAACAPSTLDREQATDLGTEEKAIREVLGAQEVAWNAGNIEAFMQGYWKSDSLRFIGREITTGWQATLERYQKSYPDRAAMGTLSFTFYRFHFIDASNCLVTGRYRLQREADNPTGMFTLLLRKIDGKWLVVYDHTS